MNRATDGGAMAEEQLDRKRLAIWKQHLGDEIDARYLYAALAKLSGDEREQRVFGRLAEVEASHVEVWKKLFADRGIAVDIPGPSVRARLMLGLAKVTGTRFLVTLLIKEETEEVRSYLSLHDVSSAGVEKDSVRSLARESAEHVEELAKLTGSGDEPWHQAGTGGFVRNIIYGFNDGLTANFGLVAGVIGANVHSDIVLLSGIAGLVADALSMGASGYLAAKSEQEVYENEIIMEREEIRMMPDLEREELALIYEAKGATPEQARVLASEIMKDPERALEEKVREELKIGESHATPWREAWVTGLATAVGAFIPVFPFLLFDGWVAVSVSFLIAMAMHFIVGAARSFFTGRSFWRSGIDMFAVGFGVAIVAYVVGDLLVRWL
jgi:VIT1/CCC1 family predicted Fe2+/Mn2+ transporter